MTASPKIAKVVISPSPYMEGTHILLNKKFENNYHVYYCTNRESHRFWKMEYGDYNKTFLRKIAFKLKDRSIYLNIDILKSLSRFNPDVVITGGYFPTMLLAFLWCKLSGKKSIVFSDGTLKSEEHLTFFHRIIRKIIFHFADGYLGASKKSLDLYRSYNVKGNNLFLCPYVVDNDYYKQFRNTPKRYDIMFCGQLIDRKMPFFFIDVIKEVSRTISCKVLLVGTGELKGSVIASLDKENIDYSYPGFVQSEDLPSIYASAKILAFPTKFDAWGVVANEACAVGVPVITCDAAGAANELIINNYNGYVLPLDVKIWANHIITLLSDDAKYQKFSKNAFDSVQAYNHSTAANGIIDAVNYLLEK